MREEDIFERKDYEELFSFGGARFKFVLSRKCKLNSYDRTIEVDFSVYFDKILNMDFFDQNKIPYIKFNKSLKEYEKSEEFEDESILRSLDIMFDEVKKEAQSASQSRTNALRKDYGKDHGKHGINTTFGKIFVLPYVFNFATNSYECYKAARLDIKNKSWSTTHLILKSENISDDSTIKVKYLFAFFEEKLAFYGFLKSRGYWDYYCLTDGQEHFLTSEIHPYGEEENNAEKNTN